MLVEILRQDEGLDSSIELEQSLNIDETIELVKKSTSGTITFSNSGLLFEEGKD